MPIRLTPKPRFQPHNGAECAYTGANMSPLRPAKVGRAPLAGWKCPDVKSLVVNRIGMDETMNAFESIKQGLSEAIEHAKRAQVGVVEYHPQTVDVAKLRRRLGLTQGQFAARFGFSVATLRHWERGDRKPQGAALVLLNVIQRNPKAVLEALTGG